MSGEAEPRGAWPGLRGSRVAASLWVRIESARGGGRRVRWAEVAERVDQLDPAVVSVDVFDTVLVRRLLGPRSVEGSVARALCDAGWWPGDAESYLRARHVAEGACPDGPVRRWYDEPSLASATDPDACVEFEYRIERELVEAVPGADEFLRSVRARGRRVVFLSDMHLPGAAIAAMLDDLGLLDRRDAVVVSCEAGVAKYDGTAFGPALERLTGAARDDLVHVGNDVWSDGVQARRRGVRSVVMGWAEPDRYERVFADSGHPVAPALGGAARLARLGEPTDGDAHLGVIGAGVLGTALSAFLLWLAEQADEADVDDLLFLARDGELPLRMARAMPADHWGDRRLRYLHCNRRSWQLAAATVVGLDRWLEIGTADVGSFLQTGIDTARWRSLLDRVGLRPADVPARHQELRRLPPDAPLTMARLDLWSELLADPDVRERIAAESLRRRGPLVAHLRDTLGATGRTALVDIGWRGQLAWLASALLAEALGSETISLHFGGDGVSPQVDALADLRRFAFDDSVRPHPFAVPAVCLESFTTSGARRVVDYVVDESDARVRPVFGEGVPALSNRERRRLWAGAIRTASALPSRAALGGEGVSAAALAEEVREVLRLFWNEPTRSEAAAMSGLGVEGDDRGEVVVPVAAPYRWSDLVDSRRRVRRRAWRTGSLRLTPVGLRPVLRLAFVLTDGRLAGGVRSRWRRAARPVPRSEDVAAAA